MKTEITHHKPRPSVKFCEENCSCVRTNPPATVYCKGCNTNQCDACAKDLHSRNAKLFHHDRIPLPAVDSNKLCQSDLCCDSDSPNFADFFCSECDKRLCVTCNRSVHQVVHRRRHQRIDFEQHLANQIEESVVRLESLSPPSSLHTPSEGNSFTDDFLSCIENGTLAPIEVMETSTFDDPPISPEPITEQPSREGIKHVESAGDAPDRTRRDSEDELLQENPVGDVKLPPKCVHLLDNEEKLLVADSDDFLVKMGCAERTQVKVISIFGNTGDGKSHTLNHAFFEGASVFPTSPSQTSCTAGVWAAYEPRASFLLLDTEGLLGISSNQNKRTRLLLKVLAVSDVVIYRTRAARLHSDMFGFLSDASEAYANHFHRELERTAEALHLDCPASKMGPGLIIFQETRDTEPLSSNPRESSKHLLDCFNKCKGNPEAYSEMRYVGVRTLNAPTDFTPFVTAVRDLANNRNVRAPRSPRVVFECLTSLNQRFCGAISSRPGPSFPEQYFTCSAVCQACSTRCNLSVNHQREGKLHDCGAKCKYVAALDNKVYLCKKCHANGKTEIVVPKASEKSDSAVYAVTKYLWYGYVLECVHHGVIYRSHQYWLSNPDPEREAVITEYRHLWPGQTAAMQGTHNAAQRVLDGVSYLRETVSDLTGGPSRMMRDWINDRVAPPYWRPNSGILECSNCGIKFETQESKHHCRACGEGVCKKCSQQKLPVPERGWGNTLVRVCDSCVEERQRSDQLPQNEEETPVKARKVAEAVTGAVGVLSAAIKYPRDLVKSAARPTYWVPDDEAIDCFLCKNSFSDDLPLHHCRSCGRGVCAVCSPTRCPVPLRGWDQPVRVCTECEKELQEGKQKTKTTV